jgi:ribosomal-protein-serine acetyltransferase
MPGPYSRVFRFPLADDLHLRPLEESDADELYALVESDRAHLARWMPWAQSQSREGIDEFIRGTRKQLSDGDLFQVAIVSEAAIAGVAGFHGIDRRNRSTSIGYWLAERYEGRGIMTRTVRVLVDHALGAAGLHRVEIRVAPGNTRSRAIPMRLGFREEGTLRESERLGDGYLDSVVYGMLAHEWAAHAG